MGYEIWLGLRYLLGRRKEKFISIISVISVIGIATGVATLIIVIGVMNGFDNELREKIIGANSHIVVDKIGGLDDAEEVMQKVGKIKHVMAAAPFINAQAMLCVRDRNVGVVIRGIDAAMEVKVTALKQMIKEGNLSLKDNSVILGKELVQRSLIKLGDEVELVSPADISRRKFKVSAIFSSGMYDFDSNLVFMDLDNSRQFSEVSSVISGISIKVDDAFQAEKVKKEIQNNLGFPYYTRTWMDLNRSLFNALKLEKTTMFIILTLIILVAALNIISTLIMMVMEKTKDIGILKAIGATNKSIKSIFTFAGLFIGIIGTTLGAAGGLCMAYLLKTYQFIKLPKDVYYIDKLPVKVDNFDVLMIFVAALCISLLATLYPAYQAARLNPVEALRYE